MSFDCRNRLLYNDVSRLFINRNKKSNNIICWRCKLEDSNGTNLLIILAILLFGAIIVVLLTVYYTELFQDIKYIKMEINRSYDRQEKRYWKKELHRLYWSLIPGLSPQIVNNICYFFSRKKR